MATKRHSRSSRSPWATGFLPSRTGSCATSISPRMRRSRRCSTSGETFRNFATQPASRPGRTESSSVSATAREADSSLESGPRLVALEPPDATDALSDGPRSGPARARLPKTVRGAPRRRGAPLLHGPVHRPRSRNARHLAGDGQITSSSRDARATRGDRRRRTANHPGGRAMTTNRGDGAHRSVVAGAGADDADG